MPEITLPNNWRPRPYQMGAWRYFEAGGKRAVLVWHRRAGKDELALHLAAVRAMIRPATYWHMLPEASQARKAIWEAVNPHTGRRRIDEAFPLALRSTTRENEMLIKFVNGSTWQLVGSDNFNSLVGSPPAGVVFSEYALADPQSWGLISPILRENDGWCAFISTPRGRNHLKTIFDFASERSDWYAERLTVNDTAAFSAETQREIEDEYRAQFGEDMGKSLFEQEYLCSWDAAVLGAFYGRLLLDAEEQDRITSLPYEPTRPVWTAWDLGVSDHTAIWFAQVVGTQIRLIDYYESAGHGADHYAALVKAKPYQYEGHIVPHDAFQREWGTGKTRTEMLRSLGLKGLVECPGHEVLDGINGVRSILPRCVFDKAATAKGLDALRMYRSEWDDKNRTLKPRPLHDWASHGADAFRYLAMGLDQYTPLKIDTRAHDRYRRREEVKSAGWVAA